LTSNIAFVAIEAISWTFGCQCHLWCEGGSEKHGGEKIALNRKHHLLLLAQKIKR
jgi:hypothetical protein